MEAASIYKEGWAHEVWITRRSIDPEDVALAQLGIQRTYEDTYSEQVLESLGCPKRRYVDWTRESKTPPRK
jgi:hypothetical protein